MKQQIHNMNIERLAAGQIMAATLASALADPRSPLAERCGGASAEIVDWAWRHLAQSASALSAPELGLGERLPAEANAAQLTDWLALTPMQREPVHQRIFGLVVSKICPPYETEYCAWKDTTHRSQELADIAGFYRAFGLQTSRSAPERADHVSLELEFIALLNEKQRLATLAADDEHADICRNARTAFLRDHVTWWMPTFGRLLEKRAQDVSQACEEHLAHAQYIAGVARLLCAWVAVERALAGIAPVRRIIGPSVAPQEPEADCGSCGSCVKQEIQT